MPSPSNISLPFSPLFPSFLSFPLPSPALLSSPTCLPYSPFFSLLVHWFFNFHLLLPLTSFPCPSLLPRYWQNKLPLGWDSSTRRNEGFLTMRTCVAGEPACSLIQLPIQRGDPSLDDKPLTANSSIKAITRLLTVQLKEGAGEIASHFWYFFERLFPKYDTDL